MRAGTRKGAEERSKLAPVWPRATPLLGCLPKAGSVGCKVTEPASARLA